MKPQLSSKKMIATFCLLLTMVACKKENLITENTSGNLGKPKGGSWTTIEVYPPNFPNEDLGVLLQNLIDAASPFTIFHLNGHFFLESSVKITNKDDITITGSGCGNTEIHIIPCCAPYPDNTFLGFEIASNVHNLEISNMTIIGNNPNINIQTIGSHWGSNDIQYITIKELCIYNVSVGISVGAGADVGDYRNVIINDNIIQSPAFDNNGPGEGYGIHNDNAKDVEIYNNHINKAGRHSIYQGRGERIRIKNNFITNHGQNAPSADQVALVVARSREVVVQDNIILNCYTKAISAEHDETPRGWPTDRLTYVNNQIIGGRNYGFLMSVTQYPISVLGNKFIPHTGMSYTFLHPADCFNPNITHYTPYPPLSFCGDDVGAMVRMSDNYFVMRNAVLTRISDASITGAFTTLSTSPSNWFNFAAMTELEGAVGGQDRLYIVQNNVLHEVDPNNGCTYQYSPASWFSTQAMCSAQGYVHIMQNNRLHRIEPSTLNYYSPLINWAPNFGGMCSWGGYIYILQNYVYHQVDPISLQIVYWWQ